jgi:epoxyqueuosine reductase
LSPDQLTAELKGEAHRLGFELAGAAPAIAPPRIEFFRQWLADGFAGKMKYLSARAAAYEHPRHVSDGAASLLMLGMNYRTAEPVPAAAGEGTVARYAWGEDYHAIVRRRLRRLVEFHRRLVPQAAARGVVDTAPLLEREFAQLAGLGWIGKNTLLLNRQLGSWFVLAALLTTEPLAYDEPVVNGHLVANAEDHEVACKDERPTGADQKEPSGSSNRLVTLTPCGTCRACLDACPTGALVAPYRLDARRCLAYLTIERREEVPEEFRAAQGSRVFGCDACQEVCPWNRRPAPTSEPGFWPRPGMNPMPLAEVLQLDPAAFRARFHDTALARAGEGLRCHAVAVMKCGGS